MKQVIENIEHLQEQLINLQTSDPQFTTLAQNNILPLISVKNLPESHRDLQ